MPEHDTTTVDRGATVGEAGETSTVGEAGETSTVVEVVQSEVDDLLEEATAGGLVIRHVLGRQLVAGHGLSAQLLDAATEVSVAVAHAPATVVAEIRGGATLPAALTHSGTEVRGVVAHAGSRVRTAVGEYVGNQAVLPNAFVVGAVDVVESVLRAQGSVAACTVDAVFTVAAATTNGTDVRATIAGERAEIGNRVDASRDEIGEAWARAIDELRSR